jgi:hypothetical protein
MPELTLDFTWYKDSKGYRLVPGTRPKPGQSLLHDVPASEVVARIVRNDGRLVPWQPLRIGDLFERFSRLSTAEELLKFVERYGPLTRQGLRGKGDVVGVVLNEARSMRLWVGKPLLEKLDVSIDITGGETRLKVTPACLLDAIWLQYAQSGARSRECPQCHKRFLVGAAAGRRRDAQYCDDECRKRYNSLKRSRR